MVVKRDANPASVLGGKNSKLMLGKPDLMISSIRIIKA
jgi:hypothetical protein